jgi:hypothetical protein
MRLLAISVEVVNVNRRKSRKPLFHVPIFQISSKENCYTEFGFQIKTLKRPSIGTLRWAKNSTDVQRTPYKLRDFKRLREFLTTLRGLPPDAPYNYLLILLTIVFLKTLVGRCSNVAPQLNLNPTPP